MAKITEDIFYEILKQASIKELNEEEQIDLKEAKKKINDFFTYGHLPKQP